MHCPTSGRNNTGRMRAFWCLVLASLAVCVLSFPAASQPARHAVRHGGAQIYMLKGLANLSPGFDALAAKIRRHGLHVSVHNHLMGESLIPEIEQNYKHGQRRIILIGHSLGADEVVSMASRLGQAGIPVVLLVTLDPVVNLELPGNVRRSFNYFVSDGIGHAIARGKRARGVLVNRDFKNHEDIGHLSITTSQQIQRLIIAHVLSVAG
jgi:hypothetical protein